MRLDNIYMRTSKDASNTELLALSALAIPLAGVALPLAVYLPAYYAQDLGLGLGAVGAVFMATRLIDFGFDPLIGRLSDATRSRFGRRKPWIAAGAPLLFLATAAVFEPGWFGVRPGALWLGAWLCLYFLGLTLVQIPFAAWVGEMSRLYHGRTRAQTFYHVASAAGLLAVLVLPSLLDAAAHAHGSGAGIAGQKVGLMGVFILATLAPATLLVLFGVREPDQAPVAVPPASAPGRPRRAALFAFAQALADPLLLRILASDFAVTFAQLVRSALIVFFVGAYLHRPDLTASLFLLQFIFGVAAGPLWLAIARRLGKHRTAALGEFTQVVINLLLFLATPDALAYVIALTVAQGLAQGSGNLMLRAMVSDVADHQKLRHGEDRTGLLFSMFSLSAKLAMALSVGVALPLIGALGFHPGGHNTPAALFGLKAVFTLGPALAHLVSASLVLRFPLDEAAHAAALDALAAPSAAPLSFPDLKPRSPVYEPV